MHISQSIEVRRAGAVAGLVRVWDHEAVLGKQQNLETAQVSSFFTGRSINQGEGEETGFQQGCVECVAHVCVSTGQNLMACLYAAMLPASREAELWFKVGI